MPELLYNLFHRAGIAQLAERKLPKLEVAGSTPVARSIFPVSGRFTGLFPDSDIVCHDIITGKLNPAGGLK